MTGVSVRVLLATAFRGYSSSGSPAETASGVCDARGDLDPDPTSGVEAPRRTEQNGGGIPRFDERGPCGSCFPQFHWSCSIPGTILLIRLHAGSHSVFRPATLLGGLLVCLAGLGCESTGLNTSLLETLAGRPVVSEKEMARRRAAYIEHHNREDLYWLLQNCVTTGMGVHEVAAVVGETPELEPHSQWLKQADFRVDDKVYKFGPDSQGQSVYLLFREGRLINHNPDEYRPDDFAMQLRRGS